MQICIIKCTQVEKKLMMSWWNNACGFSPFGCLCLSLCTKIFSNTFSLYLLKIVYLSTIKLFSMILMLANMWGYYVIRLNFIWSEHFVVCYFAIWIENGKVIYSISMILSTKWFCGKKVNNSLFSYL